jgi:LytR cell envelope-related transcriptional attenuator
VSSRGRGREPDWDDDWEGRDRSPRRRPAPRRPARTFGLPIVAAALVVGLIIGFVASCGGGGTKTVTETQTVTAPTGGSSGSGTSAIPSGAASRATIALAFLNGSGESGLAASRADAARALGYQNVTVGDAPSPVTSDRVVYRKGAAGRAAQVAQDLGLDAPTLLPAGDPVLTTAPDASVIVLLGPSGATTTSPGTSTAPDALTSTTG